MTDCYIDPTYGDDDGTGTDANNPYRTFKNLSDGSHTLEAGNRVHLLSGKTFRDELSLQDSGSAQGDIIVTKYGDGDNPVILGSDRANGLHLETNMIVNPSFENWTGNIPDDWTVIEQGGTELREETTDVSHLLSAVSIEYESDKTKFCSIRNTAALTLDDNRIYTLSYMHKDPAIVEDDGQAYIAAVIWRTDSVGSTDGEYWVVDESGVGMWSLTYLFGNMAETRAWWHPAKIDIDTGVNGNALNYYYVKFEAFRNPNEFDGEKRDYYELQTFLLDAVSLGPKHEAAVGSSVITDGGFEEWDTSDDLTEWAESFHAGESDNYVFKNETEVYSGDYSLEMYVGDVEDGAGVLSVLVKQESLGNLGNNTTWDLKTLHKQSRIWGWRGTILSPVEMAVLVWRTGGSGADEYLVSIDDVLTWQALVFTGFPITRSLNWVLSEYEIETGANANGHTDYNIAVAPYQPYNGYAREQTSDTSYYVDGIVLNKQGSISGNNKFSNPRFDDWTGSSPDDWTTFSLGSSILEQHDNRRFGDYSIRCTMDTDDSDVGVRQIVTLEGSTTYRLGIVVMCHEGAAAYTVEVAATVKRNSDGYYWDGTSWVTDIADAISAHSPEFERHAVDVTTDSGDGTYTISIHRAETTFTKEREQFYIDYVSMVAKDEDTEVYKCQFGDMPRHVYFTGSLSGQTETRLQLYDDTWDCVGNSEKNHPHIYGYTYDRVTQTLYVNVGEPLPDSYFIECSVRDNNIDCNEESYITIQDLTLYTTKRNNVDLGSKVGDPNQRDMTVKRCDCQYAGEAAIAGGYVQPLPYDGATSVQDESYQFPTFALTPMPPMNVRVNDNTLKYFARNRKMRVETAEDQLLDDPDVEDWDSATDLADWTEVEAKAGDTVSQESLDVREGTYAVKCETGSDVLAFAGIKQEGITGVFTTDITSRTVVIYYKCSTLDERCALILGRTDSAGGANWEFLEADSSWNAANPGTGHVLPASTEWARYEITFTEGANPSGYEYYKFIVGPYVSGTQNDETYYFDRMSFHSEYKDWWAGYGPKDCGFLLQPGPYINSPASAGIGLSQLVHVKNNDIECDIGYENWNTGRAGITVKNGGWVGGNPVVIEGNYVTNVDHGISVFGAYATVPGNVGHVNILYNEIYHTGDDNCWVEGIGPSDSYLSEQNMTRIMYNIFDGSRDNGLEVAHSVLVEVYGNLFNNHGNESLALYTEWYDSVETCAYIYNNIFYNWGEDWVSGNPGKLRGCAIGAMRTSGLVPIETKGKTYSDYNFFYATHDTAATDHPFEMIDSNGNGQKKTFAEWQAYGFDYHSTITNPVFIDIANNNYRVRRGSPCIDAGLDLSTVTDSITYVLASFPGFPFTFSFFASIVIDDALDTRTTWPDNVMTMEQGEGAWNVGPWADPVATITRGDGDPEFPTDKSLYGIAAYVLDTVNYRIWKGVIVSNTADELSLDDWEPVFNADGLYPEGTYPYYIGYIYLYDKTPEFSFVNSHWEKGLREYEFLTNDIAAANLAFFRQTLNGGETEFVNDGNFEGNRLSVKVIRGLHRIMQQEHAMLTKQKIHIKEMTYHVDWKRGKMDQ